MNRIIGWCVRLLVVIGVVVVLAVAAVRFLLPAEKLVRIGVERVERETGADVQLGRITLRFWPSLHLLVEGGSVRAGGGGLRGVAARLPGLEAFALRWHRLSVGLSWRGLLRRRIELGRIELVQPDLQLISRKVSGTSTPGTTGGGGAALALAGLSVRDGRLHWQELDSGRELGCVGWSQEVDLSHAPHLLERLTAGGGRAAAAGRTDRIGWRARIDTLTWRPSSGEPFRRLDRIAVALDLELPPAGDHWVWRLRELSLPGLVLEGEGRLDPPVAGGPGRITGAWRMDRWEPRVLPHAVAAMLPPSAAAAAAWLQRQDLSGAGLDVTGTLDRPVPAPRGPGISPAEGIGLEASFRALPLRPLHHADRWLADGTARLAGGRLTVELERLAPVDGTGTVTGALAIDPVGSVLAVDSLAVRWQDLDVATLLRWGLERPGRVVRGTATGRLDLAWRGKTGEQWRRTVTGDGEIVLGDGVLHAKQWLGGLRPYLGERQDLLTIPYHRFATRLRVADGRIRFDDLTLDGPQTAWRATGWVGLAGDVDARLRVVLPAGFSPGGGMLAAAAALLRDDQGRITIPLHLSGRLARPTVAVELPVDRERLRRGVQGLLDKLRGKE